MLDDKEMEESIARLRECRVTFEGVTLDAADALLVIGRTFPDRPFTMREFNDAMIAEVRRRKRMMRRWWKPWTWCSRAPGGLAQAEAATP